MVYTKKEKAEIERVREVFAEHIRQSPNYELLWSDKVGYVWLCIGIKPLYVDTGRRIESASDLCELLLNDVADDVLEMTVDEGVEFFSNHPKIYRKLLTLQEVGLGYVKIGQPATTLSGGEAQRVKLAAELSKRSTGKTIYVLDEPTTGLHTADVHKLLEVLERLTDGGNTVLVIEHNLDVIKTADYLIDLGPEGGDKGGTLVCCGTPEEVAACDKSYTGRYLKPMLSK